MIGKHTCMFAYSQMSPSQKWILSTLGKVRDQAVLLFPLPLTSLWVSRIVMNAKSHKQGHMYDGAQRQEAVIRCGLVQTGCVGALTRGYSHRGAAGRKSNKVA